MEEVVKLIQSLQNYKAQGASGIAPKHLKYLARTHTPFMQELTNIYNTLMDHPAQVKEIRALYNFRSVFIPKGADDVRPIAICEQPLLVFHKILTNRLRC